MPLDAYNNGNFRDYLGKNAGGDDTLWVLVHLPKTAGTSLGSQLMRWRKPSHNINTSKVRDELKGSDTRKALDNVLEAFLTSADVGMARFMTGHFDASQASCIQAARPDCRFIAMLRDPVERVISQYRYMLTEKHPEHLEFRASFPDIQSYVQHPRSQNIMCKRLVPRLPITNPEAFDFIKKRFSFIGLSEEYEMSLQMLNTLLGVTLDPSKRLNATAHIAENMFKATPEIRSQIEDANKRDIALYRHFSNLFHRCATSMRAPPARPQAARPAASA